MDPTTPGCGTSDHLRRRTLLGAAAVGVSSWLTPLSQLLATQAERRREPARSVILLWLQGGASQLDTFDPHPDGPVGGGVKSIGTAIPGVRFASGLAQTASVLDRCSLIRSVRSVEGDHERASYHIRTGYRINPALVHPSIGAVVCHELGVEGLEIPAHVSILPGPWPSRGGYLGARWDAFKLGDPSDPIRNMNPRTSDLRWERRWEDLSVVEQAFRKGREAVAERTHHLQLMEQARRMMTSDQLDAFRIEDEPASLVASYGDTPFGRGCLAARRLIEAGVRCVEVTLNGWDSHVNNLELQAQRVAVLDPALATLIRDLEARDLLDRTVVLCGGEFGRTPKINPLEGRDHWPHGFSVLMAGGGIARGRVLGATDPSGEKKEPVDPVTVPDLHATVQKTLGIDPEVELMTPVNRPLALSEGTVIRKLL